MLEIVEPEQNRLFIRGEIALLSSNLIQAVSFSKCVVLKFLFPVCSLRSARSLFLNLARCFSAYYFLKTRFSFS